MANRAEKDGENRARKRLGISYNRFSDPKQGKGDSADRQDRGYREFCRRHDLTPAAEVFADRGRSGYKDEHRKKGHLGRLVALAKDGKFDPGTVIVVEAWDRLGRLRPDRQTDLIAELLRTGVHIGICRLDDIFTEDDFGTHKWTTLAVFIQLAYQESKQKAERVAESWEQRRKKAREDGSLLTGRLPAWLEIVNGEVRVIPDRAAVVNRIFRLAAEGFGHTLIVRTLSREGVPPFGEVIVREDRTRSQFSGKWTRPYLALILNDRRAVGEFQPRKLDGTPDGPPIPNYFPPVISENDFLLARAGQEERISYDAKGRWTRARQVKYTNLFKGFLKHARDGEGVLLHNKGSAAAPQLLLINTAGLDGRDRCYTFPYPVFEEAILRLLCEVDPKEVLPSEKEAPSAAAMLRAKLANIRADIAHLKADLSEGYSKTIATVLREREAEEETVAADLQDELTRAAQPAAKAWEQLPTLADLIRKADDPEEARLRLRPVLRRVVADARMLVVPRASFRLCVAQFFFADSDACRSYLIAHQTAAYRRIERWQAWSLAEVAEVGARDLRDREDAQKLEAVLGALDVDELLSDGHCKPRRRRKQ